MPTLPSTMYLYHPLRYPLVDGRMLGRSMVDLHLQMMCHVSMAPSLYAFFAVNQIVKRFVDGMMVFMCLVLHLKAL